jgi:regulator of sirC expression with transglutaminase-like and TPR domain
VLDGNDPANYQTRAAVMKALSRKDDAINDLKKALTLNPSDTRRRQIESALLELEAKR